MVPSIEVAPKRRQDVRMVSCSSHEETCAWSEANFRWRWMWECGVPSYTKRRKLIVASDACVIDGEHIADDRQNALKIKKAPGKGKVQSVSSWLRPLSLEQHSQVFAENEVGLVMSALPSELGG